MINEKTNPGWQPNFIHDSIDTPDFLTSKHQWSKAEIKSIHRHENKLIHQMKPIYRIQETVYFVMRYSQPF